MATSLKNHPFAVEAFFESSLVLTFAFPKALLEDRIPECLQLDTFQDKWAFLAVAIVKTKDLRAKSFPKWLGRDFILIGYRVFVRYKTSNGKNLRGLYILKSETDSKIMEWMGNMFTHYNYSTTDVLYTDEAGKVEINSAASNMKLHIHKAPGAALPADSPFMDWKEARRFAGPLPFTFTYNTETNEVLIVEGVRNNWTPQPVEVTNYDVGFLQTFHPSVPVLANAFIIENIPYYWKKGKLDLWHKTENVSRES